MSWTDSVAIAKKAYDGRAVKTVAAPTKAAKKRAAAAIESLIVRGRDKLYPK